MSKRLRREPPKLEANPKKLYAITSPATGSAYIGISVDPGRRYLGHLRRPSKKMAPFIGQATHLVVFDVFFAPEVTASLERQAISIYREEGWDVFNSTAGGEIGTPIVKWTLQALSIEAKKHKTKRDFRTACPNGHAAARRNGWISAICSHMPKRSRPIKSLMRPGSRRWLRRERRQARLVCDEERAYLSARSNESSPPRVSG